MKKYIEYVAKLERLTEEIATLGINKESRINSKAALDGEASAEFRRLVSLKTRRRHGAFFSNSIIAEKAIRMLNPSDITNSFFLDPTCGIGDLLIACSSVLPIGKNVEQTLNIWSERLGGIDIHKEFIRTSKARLLLNALTLSDKSEIKKLPPMDELFAYIQQGDVYHKDDLVSKATHILINPPYGYIQAPDSCEWGDGRISAAASFLDEIVSKAHQGTIIVAILPDVLRSGQRYNEWRKYIQGKATVEKSEIYGQFDRWTDIDVFLLKLFVRSTGKQTVKWWSDNFSVKQDRLKDLCEVHVGPVVPYRDPKKGLNHEYVYPQVSTPWGIIKKLKTKRKYDGQTYEPPFIVVRRTSRPGDKYRTVGTIVSGTKPIAVENHLMIVQPNDRTIRACKTILKIFKDARTTKWLNKRIRCRHLTVDSLRNLPIWD